MTGAGLLPVRVVGVAGPELPCDTVVILAARVGVADQQRDRRAGGPSLVHAGQDLDGIGFVPRRSVPRAPGRATRTVVGEVARRDRDVRRAALDPFADRRPVGLAEGGDPVTVAER